MTRMVNRAGRRAGLGHLHPHQLRHTLATQAINRGMRLEAIAALLGHRTLRMTIRYARIANRTVADEYQAVSAKVEALYAEAPLGADAEGPTMRRVRAEHPRMLANGWCTRPAELDCSFEAICEGCGFFATTVEFKDTLTRQADHAAEHGQQARQSLYEGLLHGLDEACHDRRPLACLPNGTLADDDSRRPRRRHRDARRPAFTDVLGDAGAELHRCAHRRSEDRLAHVVADAATRTTPGPRSPTSSAAAGSRHRPLRPQRKKRRRPLDPD